MWTACSQNADDNAYATSVSPCWELHSTSDAVWTVHNELGLRERDVRGLCDAGASTKRGSAAGVAIGRKGIGFKSVFKLSSRPQVFSHPFAFEFDLGKGLLGYILPDPLSVTTLAALPARA